MKPTVKRLQVLLLAALLCFTCLLPAGCTETVDTAVSTTTEITSAVTTVPSATTTTVTYGGVTTTVATPTKPQPSAPSAIPAYSGKLYVPLNGNVPVFSSAELTTTAYERYAALDSLGRTGTAIASCGREIMPKDGEERGSISSVKPSGWVQARYDCVNGSYLYNRCHLIGWQLSAENANKQNLITGTRYMNTEGMLPFENMIADYIHETGNHVAYRVTPVYDGNDRLARGVQLEAMSVEDGGDGICFNMFIYNVQPGIVIDYATGNSRLEGTVATTAAKTTTTKKATITTAPRIEMVWIPKTGSKYHSRSDCSNMKTPSQMPLNEAINQGYEPCKRCH